jgi:hypothetical protein
VNGLDRPALCQVRGAIEAPTLGSLKTAEEVAALVRISADRLRELAEVQVVPHFRIDGGPHIVQCVWAQNVYSALSHDDLPRGTLTDQSATGDAAASGADDDSACPCGSGRTPV